MITGSGAAWPELVTQEALWTGFFSEHFGGRRAARAAFDAAGVVTRHAAVNPLVEDISRWSTAARMERYLAEAMPLGKAALTDALDAAGCSAAEIGLLVVVSCTGYATPGIDLLLARDLGMSSNVARLAIGHMGCHAALPALDAVKDYVVAHGAPAALLCLELSSLHLQPPTTDLGQIVVHSLFSDAAAAVVVEPAIRTGRPGLQVVDSVVHTEAAAADDMTWTITDVGFRMTLSRRVSEVVERAIAPLVSELLARNSIPAGMVDGWAVHPGGPRILDVVGRCLRLPREDLAASRQVLSEHGNCSSSTTLLVLDVIRRQLGDAPGRHLVTLGFGPGLTLCATLLRTV